MYICNKCSEKNIEIEKNYFHCGPENKSEML